MPDYGKISWQSTKLFEKKTADTSNENPVTTVLELCKKYIPYKTIIRSDAAFVEERATLHETHEKIIEKISQHPLVIAFLVWVKEMVSLYPDLANAATILLKHGFIGISDKKGKMWTVADAHGFNHRIVVDAIRSQHELSLQMKELLVKAYSSFMQWLSVETYGYINKVEDPDVARTRGRILAYPLFINFLNALKKKEKEQLVAKLLYFGGSRTLEEVLNLQLEAIDFEKKVIHYDSFTVNYPPHVFADIQALSGKRKHGRVFLGRQNVPLSHTTIFRNFKEAAIETGLGQAFSPAILTSDS